jgi:hypothetical protein
MAPINVKEYQMLPICYSECVKEKIIFSTKCVTECVKENIIFNSIKTFGNHFIFSRMVTSMKISAWMEIEKSEVACRTELNNQQMCIDYQIIVHGWFV